MARYRHVEPLVSELEAHGVTDHWIDDTGRHLRLYYVHAARQRFYIVPKSPSDRRWEYNALSDLRRDLGGRKIAKRATPKARRLVHVKRQPVSVDTFAPTEFAAVKGDPFAVLANHPVLSQPAPKLPWWRRVWAALWARLEAARRYHRLEG